MALIINLYPCESGFSNPETKMESPHSRVYYPLKKSEEQRFWVNPALERCSFGVEMASTWEISENVKTGSGWGHPVGKNGSRPTAGW